MVICNRKFRCCTSTSWREQHLNFPTLATWRSFITSNWFFSPVDLQIKWVTSIKQQGTSPRLHQALCIISKPSVNSNWSYNLEALNSGQNWQFLSHVTLKIDGWPWKTIGHLLYATSSFTHHLIAIGQFKLELQSGNAKFKWKTALVVCKMSAIFQP